MYDYAIRFEQDDTPGLAVSCRDLPQFHSCGDDEEHALREALDGIETTLSIYVDERKAIPEATPPREGERVVHLPAVTVAKIALWNAMMERDMRKADLRRLLDVAQVQSDRLVDFLHTSKMEQLEDALHKLDVRLNVSPRQLLSELEIYEWNSNDPTVLKDAWCSTDYVAAEEGERNQPGWFSFPEAVGISPERIGRVIAKTRDPRNNELVMSTDLNRPNDLPHARKGVIHLPVTFYVINVVVA